MTDRVSKRRQRRKSKRDKTPLPKVSGRRVRNKGELDCYQKLRELAPSGTRISYEADKFLYQLEGNYLVDFTIQVPKKYGGKNFFIEFKGAGRSWDSRTRQKMIAVRDQNPDDDFRIVFYRDAEFGAKRKDGSRQRQSDWATRNGFDFCIGVENIPDSWFIDD